MKRLAVVLALALTRTAAAQSVDPDVTIDKAVELYRAHNPRLAATRAAVDVTAADLVDADIYPNPTIGASVSHTVHGTATSGDTLAQGELDIPLLVGKRGARGHAAEHRVATTRADVAQTEADGAREVRRRFVALLAAQERVTAMTAAADEARKVRTIVAGRQAAGAKSPYDLERADLALATVESKLAEATADQLAASSALAAAVGIAGWQPHAAGTFRPATTAPPTAIDPAHPALAKPKAAEAQAHAEAELAHAEARPTPSLALSGYNTTGPSGIALTLGLSLPLPLFDRNQGAVARAQAQAKSAALEHDATAFELHSTLERATKLYGAQKDALAKFEADAMERLPRIRTMAEDAYRSGQGGIVELLDALDAITETRIRDIDLVEGVLDTELDLRAAATGQ
jgi:cobalt-zinc-cadmium efflux system outer membrane protein